MSRAWEVLGRSRGGADENLDTADGLVWYAVGADGDEAEAVPKRCQLLGLRVRLSAISGASAVTVQLAEAADGSASLTNRTLAAATQDIAFDRDGTTDSTTAGVVAWPLDEWVVVRPQDTSGALYVGLELDAGTATIDTIELTWERP